MAQVKTYKFCNITQKYVYAFTEQIDGSQQTKAVLNYVKRAEEIPGFYKHEIVTSNGETTTYYGAVLMLVDYVLNSKKIKPVRDEKNINIIEQ